MKDLEQLLDSKPLYSQVVAIQRLFKYPLLNPIYITIETYSDGIIAEHPDTESWAEGETEYEAIDNLRIEIEALYEDLREIPDDKLGRNPLQWKRFLLLEIEGLK
jgi:hypothetical protein